MDPERPFCDVEGEYAASRGRRGVCIASPFGAWIPNKPLDGRALPDRADATVPDLDATIHDLAEAGAIDAPIDDATSALEVSVE